MNDNRRDRHADDDRVLNLILKGMQNIHADVHGLREKLAAIEAKIDNGITAEDLARIAALTKEGARLVTILKGVDAQN